MTDLYGNLRRALHRFPVVPSCVPALGVAPRNALPRLLTARKFLEATEAWSYDAADEEEVWRAVTREAAPRYQVAARFEDSFAVLLDTQAEIERNDRVPVHSVATIDYFADVFDRALLDDDTTQDWRERGTVLVSRLRLARTIPDSDVSHEKKFLSPVTV